MYKLLRIFTLITLVSVTLVLIVIGLLYRDAFITRTVEAAQRESLVFARVLDVAVHENPEVISDIQSMSSKAFQQSANYNSLDTLIRHYATEFGVLRVNAYSLNGVVIYSTDIDKAGLNVPSSAGYIFAQSGNVNSELVALNHFYTVSGVTISHDAVNSYIPVDWSGDGKHDVILQIYTGVNEEMAQLKKMRDRFYLYAGILLLGLASIMLLMLKLAGRKIQLHNNEIARQQKEIHHYTYRDTLTGLSNRVVFKESLEQAMSWACHNDKLLAVLAIDVDGFKYVNDTFGFSSGDELLVQLAERMTKCIHHYDTLSRIGGGNFAIVFEDISDVDDATESANHLIELMSEPFLLQGQEVFVTLSIGIALYPFDDEEVDTLIQKSETALYQAKEAGRNTIRFYSSREREQGVKRFTLGNALRHAIERDEFRLYYQPIIQLGSGRIIGVEALLRWHLPSKGVVPPLEFISVLEETGLIIQVGQWVLRTACEQGNSWREKGLGDLKININISAKQFGDNNLLQHVNAALDVSKLPSHLLNLEITESLLIENRKRVIEVLDQLNNKGVSMSVDDFGTGYSSMAYLKDMPIETIKIDKSFVQGIPYDMNDVAIIHAIDYLSKKLRLDVIAEGVETEAQMNFLRNLNVFAMQGYFVSRPVPAAELESLLHTHDPTMFQT